MNAPNPLVAQRQDSTNWHTGLGLVDDAASVYDGVKSGSWIEGGLGVAGAGLDMLSMVTDPVGTLVQQGLSWLIEHVQVLRDALNKLAGDADQISAYSQTWKNVAQAVGGAAQDFGTEVKNGTAGWHGEAADAYRNTANGQVAHITAAAKSADTIGTVVELVGVLVGTVRGLVRELIAECISTLIVRVAEWVAEEVGTLGLGTPWVVSQAVSLIAKWVEKISSVIRKLTSSLRKLEPLIGKLKTIWADIKKGLSAERSVGSGARDAAHGADVTTPSGSTVPSEAHTPTGTHDGAPQDGGTHGDSTTGSGADTTTPGGADTPGSAGKPGESGDPSIRGNKGNPHEDSTPTGERPACGDPIDVTTGRMMLTQTDVELPGALPLLLSRTHMSSYRVGRLYGRSWASTMDQRLELDAAGVCYAAEDGMLLFYPTPSVDGSVLPEEGPRWPLARDGDGGYIISDPERGSTFHFAARGSRLPLVAVTDRNGHRIDIVHDGDGTPVEIRHAGGYRIGVLTTDGLVTALRMVGAENGADLDLVRYRYDADRRLVEVVNSSGAALRFDYDADGRIVRWQDRNGMWYRYTFDAGGRCVRAEGDGGFLNYTFDYDRKNMVTVATNSLGHTTTYHLNAALRIVREVDPLRNATDSEWDSGGRLLSRTDPLGRTTRYGYDDAGNLTTLTRQDGSQALAEYNASRLPVTVVNPDGAVWRQTYDERGNLTAVTDPVGATTRYGYDDRGHLAAVTDAHGNTRRVQTNAAGLPLAVTDPLGATTRYTRDVFGRVTAVSDPVGGVTRFGWTIEGRLAWRSLPDGALERWTYDGEGNLVRHVDALGQLTRTEVTAFDLPAAETGPDGARLEFGYDTELRLTEVTNPQGLVWRYEYDPAGNLIRETDFNNRVLNYLHDAAGQLVERTNGADETVQFTRDLLGNVIERRSDAGAATFEFDPAGRMARAVNPDAEVTFIRDALGRVLGEIVNGRTVTSSYDLLGRRVGRRTASGTDSGWEYDTSNRPVALHTAGRTVRFGYDAAGREIQRQFGAGVSLVQSWDANHRLRSQALTATAGQPASTRGARLLQRRSYQYRADGYVDTIVEALSGVREFDLDSVGRVTAVHGAGWTERYAYDSAGNMTHAAWPEPQSQSQAQGEREYAGTVIRRAGDVRYQHDAQGRLVLRQKKRLSAKADTWHYTWDADDRLIEVITPDRSRWRYRYDPLGRRIAKQRLGPDGVTVVEQLDFSWDGSVLAEQSHSSGRSTTWEWEPDGFRPVTQTERASVRDAPQEWVDEQFYSIVTDVVGTPTELVDETGDLAWRMQTTLWGSLLDGARRAYTPLRFPGQYYDPETGLNYNYHRYYDPTTGRYTSSDPLGLEPTPNPRTYVPNPLAWSDPLGLSPCNQSFANRSEAFNAARDRAGIPRSQQPTRQWVVGGDNTLKGRSNYVHDPSPGAHGNYYQYETPQGTRVIAEHTNDPKQGPHFHAGQPKPDPSNPTGGNVDMRGQRYSQVGGKHHYYY